MEKKDGRFMTKGRVIKAAYMDVERWLDPGRWPDGVVEHPTIRRNNGKTVPAARRPMNQHTWVHVGDWVVMDMTDEYAQVFSSYDFEDTWQRLPEPPSSLLDVEAPASAKAIIKRLGEYHMMICHKSRGSSCRCGMWSLQMELVQEFEAERRAHLADVRVLQSKAFKDAAKRITP